LCLFKIFSEKWDSTVQHFLPETTTQKFNAHSTKNIMQLMHKLCSNETHPQILLGEGREVTERVTMGAEVGIPLMHQPMDPLCCRNHCIAVTPPNARMGFIETILI
jgi:hypothetical protein